MTNVSSRPMVIVDQSFAPTSCKVSVQPTPCRAGIPSISVGRKGAEDLMLMLKEPNPEGWRTACDPPVNRNFFSEREGAERNKRVITGMSERATMPRPCPSMSTISMAAVSMYSGLAWVVNQSMSVSENVGGGHRLMNGSRSTGDRDMVVVIDWVHSHGVNGCYQSQSLRSPVETPASNTLGSS